MESRKLEQLVFLICFFVAISCCLLGEVSARSVLRLKESPHNGAVDRILLQVNNMSDLDSILNTRTRRIDPLDDFKKYEGGYNITNKHYWSSTIFTGRYGYIIAAIWFVGGIILAGVLLVHSICFTTKEARTMKRTPHSEKHRFWSIFLVIFFAILALVASAVALGGSVRFHSSAESIKKIIETTANEATGSIYNVTKAIAAMQNITKLDGSLSLRGSDHLNSTVQSLNDESAQIQTKAVKNMRLVNKGIKTLEVVTVVTVVLNLVSVLALLAARPLRLHRVICLFVIFCWLLTALFWVYSGLYYFLDKFSGDTCIALDEYQQNPENSTLGTIIPCSGKLSNNIILHDVGSGLHDIIDQVNADIFTIKSQYSLNLDYVCNPFSGPPEYRYQPGNCSSDTVKIGDIPQMLKRLTCSDFGGGTCTQGEFASAIDYNKIATYTSSVQNILDIFPGTERLVDCQLVKDGFSEILSDQCKPLQRNARMTWTALTVLSATMLVLILFWTAASFYDSRHQTVDYSVRHHSMSSESLDIDMTELDPTKLRVKMES